jgi:O-glycosyl hydrolase
MRTQWTLTLALAIFAGPLGCKSEKQDKDVTVAWSDTNDKQIIDGFGASSAFFGEAISDDVADQLFDAKKGIGLSLLRTIIGLPADTKNDGSEPTDNTKPIATAPGLRTAQQALIRGAKVWGTAWTPPPIWKTTNNKNGSGDGYKSNKLDQSHYQHYADYLADFVALMDNASVPLLGVSPANEPDYTAA